jgi:hypothetical protein
LIIGVVLFLVLPLYTFFNPSNYISPSLGWILQTPVPKKQIIIANGIINFFKITLLFLIINISYILVFGNGSVSEAPALKLFSALLSSSNKNPSSVGIQGIYNIFFIIGVSFAIVFGILPDLQTSIQEKKQNAQQLNLKNFGVKRIAKYGATYLFMAIFIIFSLDDRSTLPSIFFYNIFICGIILFAIFFTLKSVKFFFNKKIFYCFSFLTIIFFIVGSASLSHSIIKDKNVRLDKRFETADFLGFISEESYDILLQELARGEESSRDIGRQDLIGAFNNTEGTTLFSKTIDSLNTLCKERLDHTCRLQGMLISIRENKNVPIEYLRLGCPKDLSSCYWLTVNSTDIEDVKLAESALTEGCKETKDSLDERTCKAYEKRNKKKSPKP